MKKWHKIGIIIIAIVIIIIALAALTSNNHTEKDIYNGTNNDSFIYKIGYTYQGKEVYGDFNISVDTKGKWNAKYKDGDIIIENYDNNPINHISITKNGEEFGINYVATEEEVDNSYGIFEIMYIGSFATISLYK